MIRAVIADEKQGIEHRDLGGAALHGPALHIKRAKPLHAVGRPQRLREKERPEPRPRLHLSLGVGLRHVGRPVVAFIRVRAHGKSRSGDAGRGDEAGKDHVAFIGASAVGQVRIG